MNKQGIRNLFSVPWLEKERYRVVYDTLKESVVIAPDGTKIKFKWDPGICNHMPYIDIHKSKLCCRHASDESCHL